MPVTDHVQVEPPVIRYCTVYVDAALEPDCVVQVSVILVGDTVSTDRPETWLGIEVWLEPAVDTVKMLE